MKHILLAFTVLIALCAPAAAEQQVYPYSYYTGQQMQPQMRPDPYAIAQQQQQQMALQQEYLEQATPVYRTYPGREQYGEDFGRIPRHPGDYRDAVDRGSWSAGQGGIRYRTMYGQ